MDAVWHNIETSNSGIALSLQELIDLRHLASQALPAQQKRLILSGQQLTSIRGRGIEFDATREYQAGDDIRSMAWRITARSLKPHIKVYREEKERPVWLAVDLSPSLYFGTRRMFKSVKSIMQAALTGWSSLHKRERVGAVIGASSKPLLYLPQSSEQHYLAILHSLAKNSQQQPSFTDNHYLHETLTTLLQHTRGGNTIYLYSDFYDFSHDIEKSITHLAQHRHVILNFVYDPFEASAPPPNQYTVSDGQRSSLFNMQDEKNREAWHSQFQQKLNQLRYFSRKYRITFNLYCTDATREVT